MEVGKKKKKKQNQKTEHSGNRTVFEKYKWWQVGTIRKFNI